MFASIDNGVIDLDNDDGIDETPSEASGLGSRLHFSLIFIDLEHEDGMDQTLSEPPRLGSRASASTNDGFIELGYDRWNRCSPHQQRASWTWLLSVCFAG